MSSTKIMTAEEIRMELARRRMTRVELAEALGMTADYVRKILREERKAGEQRARISKYLAGTPRIKNMRGIS
ncbi:MAG: hypothetical protein LHW64_07965 [Candidatus Cloacimonetes bacterium]|nr:hypothetical protein [Candidatus Cloacimonadota bacterium]MDY0230047.1 hypothetical protein [Candidatus Cloacimonadaceae bacterium]